MKKSLAMILVLVLLAGIASALAEADSTPPLPPHIKDGVSVVAIFAAAKVNPIQGPEGAPEDLEPIMADAILLYYSDDTFDQYVETPKGYELFSTGTYSFKDEDDFILTEDEDDDVIVIGIEQQYSMEERQLVDASISEEHPLGTIASDMIFGPNDGKDVEAVFADDHVAIDTDENGVISKLDAVWIYFDDGTFAEYAFKDDKVIPYGSGTYGFNDGGDFHILPDEAKSGTITQTWDDSEGDFAGESLTFDLASTGFTCLYEKLDADLLSARPAIGG